MHIRMRRNIHRHLAFKAFSLSLRVMLSKSGRGGEVNTVTINDSFITVPEAKPLKIVEDVNFCSADYKTQIWPLEEQRRQQQKLALEYEDLCRLLEKKMAVRNDHESRGDAIRERMRRKLEERNKNNLTKK